MKELFENSIADWRQRLTAGDITAVKLAEKCCDWIERLEPDLNALISYDREIVLAQAVRADEMIAAGQATALTGIPIILKDNMATAGVRTTAGSKMLENFIPPFDATVVSRLKKAGAVIVAKANLDEFAMGSSNESSYFGPVKNPWDLERVPGGSSGGPAVAVASGYVPVSLGSDTGGSIRQPASLTGLVGLKPTYGRVSRYGLFTLASSLDQIGPFGRRVEDVAEMMQLIAGVDEYDSTTVDENVPDYVGALAKPIKGLKVGLVKELSENVDPQIAKVLKDTVAVLESEGAIVEEVSLPEIKYSIAIYYIVQTSECSANLARYDGIRYGLGFDINKSPELKELDDYYKKVRQEGFGPEVKRRIMLGTYSLSSGYYDEYFNKAAKVRTLLINSFKILLSQHDVLLGLTSPITAFKIGEKINDPLSMYLADIMTVAVSLAGLPAISIPIGSVDGLPVGGQLIGNYLAEDKLLNTAYRLQEKMRWQDNIPTYIKELME